MTLTTNPGALVPSVCVIVIGSTITIDRFSSEISGLLPVEKTYGDALLKLQSK